MCVVPYYYFYNIIANKKKMRAYRIWMYGARLDADSFLTSSFVENVEEFLIFAFNHEEGNIVS